MPDGVHKRKQILALQDEETLEDILCELFAVVIYQVIFHEICTLPRSEAERAFGRQSRRTVHFPNVSLELLRSFEICLRDAVWQVTAPQILCRTTMPVRHSFPGACVAFRHTRPGRLEHP